MISKAALGDRIKAARDWPRLRREGISEGGSDLTVYIADNTEDPRCNGTGFPPGYHELIGAWMATHNPDVEVRP